MFNWFLNTPLLVFNQLVLKLVFRMGVIKFEVCLLKLKSCLTNGHSVNHVDRTILYF